MPGSKVGLTDRASLETTCQAPWEQKPALSGTNLRDPPGWGVAWVCGTQGPLGGSNCRLNRLDIYIYVLLFTCLSSSGADKPTGWNPWGWDLQPSREAGLPTADTSMLGLCGLQHVQ